MSSALPEAAGAGPVEAWWRFRGWTVPITVVIGILAGLAALATSGTSTASTTMYLTDPRGAPVFRDGSSNPADLARYAHQRAEFAQSAAVFAEVVDMIAAERSSAADAGTAAPAGETVDTLDDIVDATPTSSSDVRIECTADDEARAVHVCEQIVVAYVTLTNQDIQDRADATIAAYLTERDRLIADPDLSVQTSAVDAVDLKIAEIRAQAALFGSGVEFFEPPVVEEDSRLLPAIQYGIAGLLFAAFATAAVAWFRAGRRPEVTSSSAAVAALRAPLLGEITADPDAPFQAVAPPGAAYQLLATSLAAVDPEGGVVLTASPRAHPDAPETVARLAIAAAREGRRVLVIDGNLRTRALSKTFGVEQVAGGLTEVLAGLTPFDDVRRSIGVGGAATLDLLTGGRPIDDPSSLFRSHATRTTLAQFRASYDLVLVDVPPLLTVADGSALAGEADGVVLVVGRGTEAHDLDTVRQRLDVLRAPLIGVVYDHRAREHSRVRAA